MKRWSLFLAVGAALLLIGCTNTAPSGNDTATDAVSAATEARYRDGELREYEGTRLDPAVGPRDNSISGIQQIKEQDVQLAIDGLVDSPQNYSYADVTALQSEERLVRLDCVEGWSATILWKGVPMSTLLDAAGVQPEANTVIFHATDGYTTSLPLSEIQEKNQLLAYDANGIALPPQMGYPFIFVAEDKWGYKWARWVNRIELSSDESYQGFWESNGYSNEGNLSEPSR
ncbi:MAG: molybdopterin-dependent oxidoreductase [Christensenella sp.]|nr:molybdopterin-dependent oxidoreductase [Christensenella sp.]